MPVLFQSFVRCMLALIVWIGASGAASSAEPALADAAGPRSDLQVRLIELLGGTEICGDDEAPEADVLCGVELLADLLVDPSILQMSRGMCSRLLAELYEREVCEPWDSSCGEVDHGGLPPGPPRDLVGGAGSAVLARIGAGHDQRRVILSRARPRDDPPLPSRSNRPIAPPPRALLA